MEYKYDIAFSYASENWEYVEKVADILIVKGIKVFYDKYEEVELWGKDLGIHFEYVYSRSAKYCILFISESYSKKVWTQYEFSNAIAKAIETKEEYILPAKFDDTKIDGLRTSIAFIDLRNYSPTEFADIIIKKLHNELNHPVIQKTQEIIANIYLGHAIFTDFGKHEQGLIVTITNLCKEYRYFCEPYFKLSNGIKEKFDTFYLLNKLVNVNFPIKMEYGQPISVTYKLILEGAEWETLPINTTIMAIVTTTIGEKIESNEIEIRKFIEFKNNGK